jgi:hypothetical protein
VQSEYLPSFVKGEPQPDHEVLKKKVLKKAFNASTIQEMFAE